MKKPPPPDEIFCFQNLLKAYYRCRKTKRKSASAAEFELNFEKELLGMSSELKNKNYQTGKYICFAITDPKIREVWAADFRDRILHHLLVGCLEPIWEKKFIFHSYACRSRKGAHNAVKKLRLALNRQEATVGNLWHLKMDIESFFTSIDKTILFSLVKKHIANPDILWLAELIIFQNPPDNYIIKGDRKILASVPKHKSLFYVPMGKGLPIGNYTSQFFANVYLNELDQFIKHSLKCRHYFRYMDDLLLIHPSKEQLLAWKNAIKIFLENNLKLKLHPKKQTLQPVSFGIDFCGYIVKPEFVVRESLGAEDGAESVAIVDIVIIEVGTAVIAGYPRIVPIVLL